MATKRTRTDKTEKGSTSAAADVGARVVETLANANKDVPLAERGQNLRLLIVGVVVVVAVIVALLFSGTSVRQEGCGQAAGHDISGGSINCGTVPGASKTTP